MISVSNSKMAMSKLFIASLFCGSIIASASSHAVSIQPLGMKNTHYSIVKISTSSESDQSSAEKFISDMGDKAVGFLSNDNLSITGKQKEFKILLEDHFDMATIGRFALGKNWKSATPAQQDEYQRLFNDMIVRVYSGRFNNYQGEGFKVASSRANGKNDVLVTSYIIPNGGSKVQVDWRVRNKNGQNKIIDVIIEGVSMSLTQRSDFSSIIQRGGGNFEVLLSHLRK